MPFVQEVHAHCVACQFTVLNCEITLIIMASPFRVVTNGSHSGMRGFCDNEKGIRSNTPTPYSHGHRDPDLNPVANPDRLGSTPVAFTRVASLLRLIIAYLKVFV